MNMNNWVRVSLQPGVYTYLDRPGNDFEPGQKKKYDLLVPGNPRIKRLDNIEFLEIHKEGREKNWSIKSLKLWVNNDQLVYETTFKKPKGLGTYAVSGEELRNSRG